MATSDGRGGAGVLWLCLLIAGGACGDDSGTSDPAAGGDGDGDGDGDGPALRYDTLADTGLFSDTAAGTLAAGVVPFTPRFAHFEDGAQHESFLLLPEGATIDTSDMAFWGFPSGTRAFQHVNVGGKRVETRMLERLPDDSWFAMGFAWDADGADAVAAPRGMTDAGGSGHDVVAPGICSACHSALISGIAGFSAVQLSHDAAGTSLMDAADAGLLSDPPAAALSLPGDGTAQAALGVLHSNCGHCHNPQSGLFLSTKMDLWIDPAKLGSVEETSIYVSTVGVAPDQQASEAGARITAGDSAGSEIHRRMSMRGTLLQMPPYLAAETDTQGLAALEAWIDGL